jgi:hypothetical protein
MALVRSSVEMELRSRRLISHGVGVVSISGGSLGYVRE